MARPALRPVPNMPVRGGGAEQLLLPSKKNHFKSRHRNVRHGQFFMAFFFWRKGGQMGASRTFAAASLLAICVGPVLCAHRLPTPLAPAHSNLLSIACCSSLSSSPPRCRLPSRGPLRSSNQPAACAPARRICERGRARVCVCARAHTFVRRTAGCEERSLLSACMDWLPCRHRTSLFPC
jgi:hypothetical protein